MLFAATSINRVKNDIKSKEKYIKILSNLQKTLVVLTVSCWILKKAKPDTFQSAKIRSVEKICTYTVRTVYCLLEIVKENKTNTLLKFKNSINFTAMEEKASETTENKFFNNFLIN